MRPRTVLPLIILLAPLAGCSEALLRENVLAHTETLLGLEVSQDPRTNLYEGRVGYARHELFIVPTGKRAADGPAGPGDAASTPEVLGEIMADGTLPGAQGGHVGVYQRLAVGPHAVQSGAAVALMARDPATAGAIRDARTDQSLDTLASLSQGRVFDVEGSPEAQAWPAAVDAWSRSQGFGGYADLYARATPAQRDALARRWAAELARSRPAPSPVSKGGAK